MSINIIQAAELMSNNFQIVGEEALNKPKLLDLYCGAGGCSMGYSRAGFDVFGVDKVAYRGYPFPFIQSDVFSFLENNDVSQFDVIHASPPCHQYSVSTVPQRSAGRTFVDLVAKTRFYLIQLEKPYVIENVPGSPLKNYIELSGGMFGLKVIRRRWFESNLTLLSPSSVRYKRNSVSSGEYVTVVSNSFGSLALASDAMGIDWMTRREIVLAIPPRYTEYIGMQLYVQLN
ncbi:MAG TPA: hypothetical protein DIW31_09190 [Bacteroidales bacterium]|nr:hypothetical protein [Bacteroidales bacterium]